MESLNMRNQDCCFCWFKVHETKFNWFEEGIGSDWKIAKIIGAEMYWSRKLCTCWPGAFFREKLTDCAISTISQACAFILINFPNYECSRDGEDKRWNEASSKPLQKYGSGMNGKDDGWSALCWHFQSVLVKLLFHALIFLSTIECLHWVPEESQSSFSLFNHPSIHIPLIWCFTHVHVHVPICTRP